MKYIHWIQCRLWGLAILIAGLLLAPLVFAQETLDYTSQTMAGTLSLGALGPWDYSQIDGTVVLAQTLNPNAANQAVTPVSFNFGGAALDSSNSASSSFSFSTQNGIITNWDVTIVFHPGGSAASNLTITQSGDQYSFVDYPSICAQSISDSACTVWNAKNTSAGSWVDPPSSAPELDSRGIAGGLTLFVLVALILISYRYPRIR